MQMVTLKYVFETNILSKKSTDSKHAQNSDNLEEALAYILPNYKGVCLRKFSFSAKTQFR